MARDLTFTGLDEVRQLVDGHRDMLGSVVLLHVVNQTDWKPVACVNLTKSELESCLDAAGARQPSRAQLCDGLMLHVPVEVERQ